MSHHQPFSDFNKDDAYLGTPKQLVELIPKDCTVLWLTGHEHEFSMYDLTTEFGGVEMSVYHRLIGNGGFPQPPQKPSKHTTLKAWDNRKYKTYQLNGGRTEDYVFNGYMTINLSGPRAAVEYRTFACESEGDDLENPSKCSVSEGPSFTKSSLLATEMFEVGSDGSVVLVDQDIDENFMTVVREDEVLDLQTPAKYRQQYASIGGDHTKANAKRLGEMGW